MLSEYDRFDVWELAYSPIKLNKLKECLELYPNRNDAQILLDGFSNGFKINYHGPRLPFETKNLKSVLLNPHAANEKVENEIKLGRLQVRLEKSLYQT